jgi:chromosomal replication initiation ATPase DnaA
MSLDTVWQEALQYIQAKVPKQVYDTWFIPVHLDRIENSTAHIGVPNKFFGEWLDAHYGPLLAEAMATARGGGLMSVVSVRREVSLKLSRDGESSLTQNIYLRTSLSVRGTNLRMRPVWP